MRFKQLILSCVWLMPTVFFITELNAATGTAPNIPTTLTPNSITLPNPATIKATNAVNAPKDPNAPNQALAQSLEQQTHGDEVRWLTTNTGPFLSLYTPDKTGNQFGTVILLHGNGHHPDWPGVIHLLRTQLPEVGWSTLSIAVPNYEYQPPSTVGAPASNAIQNTFSAATPLIQMLSQRITQSLSLIPEANKPIVILAEGVSVTWLLATYNTLTDARFRGVILVSGQSAIDAPVIDFAQMLQQTPSRFFLDVTAEQSTIATQSPQRDVIARRLRSDRYQLMVMPGALDPSHSPLLLKQMRGWLRKHFEVATRP